MGSWEYLMIGKLHVKWENIMLKVNTNSKNNWKILNIEIEPNYIELELFTYLLTIKRIVWEKVFKSIS